MPRSLVPLAVVLTGLSVVGLAGAGLQHLPTAAQARLSCPPGLPDAAPAPVLVAKRLILRGTRGSVILYKQHYVRSTLPCSERDEGAIVDPRYLKGRVVMRDIFPGQQLTRSLFSNPGTDRGVPETPTTACAPGSEFNPVPMLSALKLIRKGTLGRAVLPRRLAQLEHVPCLWRWRGAITKPAFLNGRTAKRDIYAGEQLTRSQFS